MLLVLIVSVPTLSQTGDKLYLHGALGGYRTEAVDTYAIWHVSAGVQLNRRFSMKFDIWPGLSGAGANVDDVEPLHTSLSVTIWAWQITRNPNLHFVFKGGSSCLISTNHDEVGTREVTKRPLVVTAGIIFNPQAIRSFEFSVSRGLDIFEHSDTFGSGQASLTTCYCLFTSKKTGLSPRFERR